MLGVSRINDEALPHTCGSTHTPKLITGMDSFIVNSLPICHVGSLFDCEDEVIQGSESFFVEGKPVTRIGKFTKGHGCFPPTIVIEGSESFFIE